MPIIVETYFLTSLDSVESVSLGTLTDRLGGLSADRMERVCDALAVAVDCGG